LTQSPQRSAKTAKSNRRFLRVFVFRSLGSFSVSSVVNRFFLAGHLALGNIRGLELRGKSQPDDCDSDSAPHGDLPMRKLR
jgi:hypothetical protein